MTTDGEARNDEHLLGFSASSQGSTQHNPKLLNNGLQAWRDAPLAEFMFHILESKMGRNERVNG